MTIRIVDLTPDNERAIRQAAELLVIGFQEMAPDAWPNMEAALEEVQEALEPGRICRIALDEAGNVVLFEKGKQRGQPQPDSSLRDTENVPLSEDIRAYFEREVLPHAPDAWIDESRSRVGYEIPFNRTFYVFDPPRPLEEIDTELKAVSATVLRMLEEMVK